MNKMNTTLVYFLIFTIISSGFAFKIVVTAYASYDGMYSEVYTGKIGKKSTQNDHQDLIKVSSLTPNTVIASPLVVEGIARGNWYFEASFPVRLFDGNGTEIAVVPAQAQGEWMTTDFVPFKVTLNFIKPATSTGTLVLEKDNPSGDPANDDSISIPIKF